jgi:predicted nucleic acid-binding protein
VIGPRPAVIDASVAIAIVLDEPAGVRAELALRSWLATDRPMLVPGLFWLEVINTLGGGGRASGQHVLAAVHRLDVFGLQTVEPDRPLLLQVIDRSERFRLSAYDALYLALAESLDADLATLDRELAAAAGPRAITFVEDHGLHETPAVYQRDVTWPSYKGASAYLAKLRAEALAERA